MPTDAAHKHDTFFKALGALSLWLGLGALGGVLCFWFPGELTTGSFREEYPMAIVRAVISGAIAIAIGAGALALVREKRWSGGAGALAAILAITAGGSHAEIGNYRASDGAVGLDWLVIDGLITMLVLIPLEKLWPHRTPTTRRAQWRTDAIYFCINHLLIQIISVVTSAVASACFGWAHTSRLAHSISEAPYAAQLVLIFFATDLVQYATHRAMHEVPWLWRFHAVHHSSQKMDILAGSRVHFLETFATRTAIFSTFFALGFSMEVIAIYGSVMVLQATFIHANVRLPYGILERALVSPRFHHWHHSSDAEAIDKNYAAVFPIIDRLFGTHHLPHERWPRAYGVVKERVPTSLIAQQVFPFVSK